VTCKHIIRETIEVAAFVTRQYLADLTDTDLLVRPVAAANHVAWQLGHLIVSHHEMLSEVGVRLSPLPPGFVENHTRAAAGSDEPAQFLTRDSYLALLDQVRQAALAALETMSDAQLAQPAPEKMRSYAPTIASVFNTVGTHEMMHTGQFAVLRRKLGKPIVM
jgi:hypothetical protein